MMSETLDPRFETQIEQLVDQVQGCLQAETSLTEMDVEPVIGRLRDQGFGKRQTGRPLWTLVEDRVVEKYPEPAIHRREELNSLIGTIRGAWEGQVDLRNSGGR